MIEDLLTLLPTPMILPPMIVGVSLRRPGCGLEPEPLWSVLTGVPVVPGGFGPEDVPPGCDPG